MKCLICGGLQRLAFIADVAIVGRVSYWRCNVCGFTNSPTYLDMSEREFNVLNTKSHAYLTTGNNPGDPRWKQRMDAQAAAIKQLTARGLIDDRKRWLDYGCGNGYLANLIDAEKHDPATGFFHPPQRLAYGLVVSTSVFEHLRTRDEMDDIELAVGPSGVFALHTLVRDAIPDDPNWFYLQPMHCSLFTNAAMQRLFDDWGYSSSAYAITARMWFWFRTRACLRPADAMHGLLDMEYDDSKFLAYWR